MDAQAFERVVNRLQEESRRSPLLYRWKVFLVALVGQAWLVGISGVVLLLFLLCVAMMIREPNALAGKLLLVSGGLAWIIVKALRLQSPPPEGERVDRRSAPVLFDHIESLRRKIGAPRIHRVLVTDELNAGVLQQPRFGVLGGLRNHLLLGLPLMRSLTVPQFEAVLAHELGHLSGRHNVFSNHIYRLRLRWHRLLSAMQEEGVGSFLFAPFFKRYEPWFNAYSFPLARANEYEADAVSARVTSPACAAQALTGLRVVSHWLDEHFWSGVRKAAERQAEPLTNTFTAMQPAEASAMPEACAGWLERALAEKTALADTHPALCDRLAALGATAELRLPAPGESAAELLGGHLTPVLSRLDEKWRKAVAGWWSERHTEAQTQLARLSDLTEAEGRRELTHQEAYDLACLEGGIGGDPAACEARLEALLARCPGEPVLFMAVGARRLEAGRADGRGLVELAALLDPAQGPEAAQRLRDHYWMAGSPEAAHVWHARFIERQLREQARQTERNAINLSDTFVPHGLPVATIDALRQALARIAGLREVQVVRKVLEVEPDEGLWVLAFRVRAWLRVGDARTKALRERIAALPELGFPVLVVCVDGANRRIGKAIARTGGSRIA